MPREPTWYFFDINRNKLHLRDEAKGSNAKERLPGPSSDVAGDISDKKTELN